MAVFTQVSEGDLAAFLRAYNVGEAVTLDGIAEGVENSNYKLTTTEGPFILTLYEKRVDEADLPFFLSLMEFLADNGVPTARPIPQKNGARLGTLCDRPAALIAFLSGKSTLTPSPAQARAAGAALADLHEATPRFEGSRPNTLGPEGWAALLAKCAPRANEVQEDLGAELQSALDQIHATWPTGLPRGVIHADLFPDNVLFEGDKVGGLIDFYFACTDYYAYDLAVMINAWGFAKDGTWLPDVCTALVEGYETHRTLSDAERAALPLLSRGAALRFILTRLWDLLNHDPDALVTPKDPLALLPALRFHANADPSVYGA